MMRDGCFSVCGRSHQAGAWRSRPIRTRSMTALLLAATLGGCAQNGSYVDPRIAGEAASVAPTVAAIVRIVASDADAKVLVLEPPRSDQAHDTITPALVAALAAEGFTLTENSAPVLKYQVTPLAAGELLRVGFNGSTAALFFASPGVSGPLVVRKEPTA